MAWLAIGITTAIALIPQTQELFYLVPISMNHWIIAILLSLVPIIVTELIKFHKAPEVDPENI